MEPIVKYNINKIDFDLKKSFENVYVVENNNKNINFIQINANKLFLLEGCKKRIEVKVFININELYSDNIKWSYATNPLDEKSEIIQRASHINDIASDIYEIVSKRKMVNEYFSQLEEQFDLITENNTSLLEVDDIIKKYTSIIKKTNADDTIIFETSDIKMSDKFVLENEINKLTDMKLFSYNENILKLIKNAS